MYASTGLFTHVSSAHLPLRSFANCYSTAIVQLPTRPISRVNVDREEDDQTGGSKDGMEMRPQVFVSTVSDVYAVHHQLDEDELEELRSHANAHAHATANANATAGNASTSTPPISHIQPESSITPAASPPSGIHVPSSSSIGPRSSSFLTPLPLSRLPPHPSLYELLALDAFNFGSDDRVVLALTVGVASSCANASVAAAQAQGKPPPQCIPTRFYLHLYGLSTPCVSDLHAIARDCTIIRLHFVPFVLTHSTLLSHPHHGRRSSSLTSRDITSQHDDGSGNGRRRSSSSSYPSVDILLSGNDRSVHVYRWNRHSNTFNELPFTSTSGHPLLHLHQTPSAVTSLDVVCSASDPHAIHIVAGCQDGMVRVATARRLQRSSRRRSVGVALPITSAGEEKNAEYKADEHTWHHAGTSLSPIHPPSSTSTGTCIDLPSIRHRDFFLDGPVCTVSFFTPSTQLLADVFHSRRQFHERISEKNSESPLEVLQRRAFQEEVKAKEEEMKIRIMMHNRQSVDGRMVNSDDDDDDNDGWSSEGSETEPIGDGLEVQSSPPSRADGMSKLSQEPSPHVPEVRLLMANAVGFGAVYGSFDASLLSFADSWYLSGSGCYSSSTFRSLVEPETDSVLCAAAIDVNLDGRNEIVLGTYSAQLLVYEECDGVEGVEAKEKERAQKMVGQSASIAPQGYKLVAAKQLAHPVYSVKSVDLSRIGVCDLVVTTMYSVDILRWSSEAAVDALRDKLQCVEEIKHLEETLKRMQQQEGEGRG